MVILLSADKLIESNKDKVGQSTRIFIWAGYLKIPKSQVLLKVGYQMMVLIKFTSNSKASLHMPSLSISNKVHGNVHFEGKQRVTGRAVVADVDIDPREVYFLIVHFLSNGPCQKTVAQFWNELMEHQLLPRRYHAWYSRSGIHSGDENDDGVSFPLSYEMLIKRYSHIEKDHLVKLLKQLMLSASLPLLGVGSSLNAADVPTLLGTGSFSLLSSGRNEEKQVKLLPSYLRWPHMRASQVHGLHLRAIGGGFTRYHRAPSIHAACYAIARPSTMVQKMQNIKKLRGHRSAVYCAIFDRSGRYVITGSDDRLVKIWSMEMAFCLASCRGHEGDITDLAVSTNNALVASASNDFVIRVWRLPDGLPISVLLGHTGAVTAIAFSPRASAVYQLLSSSDDGTCRIWDARYSQCKPRIYVPKPMDAVAGKNSVPSSTSSQQSHQIFCCAYNANGTVFVTGSTDTYARVWSACKSSADDAEQPNHEIDILTGHENDVNYVQFSGCAATSRSTTFDALKEEQALKFKNLWFSHDNIVTCSRDGSAIIWIPRARRSHGKFGRWMKAYHLKVPPPPLPPQLPRGGPRQRILPTPRGVNMITWSLDNRFVLAAIMDCRICVWNAADGSLVHSLTGHTDSTYVLDVHPFNPRIAMSAGYDGRTIVWDIWEGTPVRIFEIGRFKLVDGKFSPDGTSIVLSDDVGQIYLLNTGQGEAQKDAKYDQFFLGDYRPLIRDALGNVLDQESQLVPYRRNIQDLLCDSSMIPYPEAYQTMYQRHRLGVLGLEWHPSSVKFAIGPDFSLGEDYQMMPLADPDATIDVPELLDATYWEPENEAISDDSDSEYNIAEEFSSEKEQESLATISYSDTESGPETMEVEERKKDGCRRSKRKTDRSEAEFTSFGRRIKRKNLEGCDSSSSRNHVSRKLGHKSQKNKTFKVKSSRPQRVAARNALSMFARIPETSLGSEDMDDLEGNSTDSEPNFQDSNVQNDELDSKEQKLYQSGEEAFFDESTEVTEPTDLPVSVGNVENRRRLVIKLPIRNSKKSLLSGIPTSQCEIQDELESSSSIPPQGKDKGIILSNVDPGSTSANSTGLKPSQNTKRIKFRYKGLPEEAVGHLNASAATKSNDIGDCGFTGDAVTCSEDHSHELKENAQPRSKIKIRSRGISMDCKTPQLKLINGVEDPVSAGENSRPRTKPAGYGDDTEDSFSDLSDYNGHSGVDFPEAETDAARRSRSIDMKATSREPNAVTLKLKLRKGDRSVRKLKIADIPQKEWMSNSTVRSSSSRRKIGSFFGDEPGPSDVRSNFSAGKISWLIMSEHEPGYRYVPQLGDEVVYLRQGHQEYIESSRSHERGPWVSMKGNINAVELCLVECLDYATVPGSGESCCKITLKFIDHSSDVFGKTFRLTFPELVNFADFLVEKTWYDAADCRNWAPGDKCLVWWTNASGEDGSWWEGQIISSKPKSIDFPDSPWERHVIRYKSDPADVHSHSPWELHDPEDGWEPPHIDFEIRKKLLSYFAKLDLSVTRNQDYYGIQQLKQISQKSDFLNRYPVPLSPEVVRSRLEHNYYRSIEAVKHDIQVMISNALSYFGKNANSSLKISRLADFFRRKLSML
ncbi:hypothetical protein Nepgr_027594 [Nepenthes gracilis]|uniref:PH-interacting protein n=1 Tax=Nepenthes gracilis TaxID=150966 RepID=A0AAD3TAS5_NEPGR|nr:hypothetical protein Nepgr_027594 [Nepenthes gracilis]